MSDFIVGCFIFFVISTPLYLWWCNMLYWRGFEDGRLKAENDAAIKRLDETD